MTIISISDDPIDYAIAKYENHPSIIMINENVSFESRFSFAAVNEDDIQREILNLNPKKPGTFGNIPTKMLKIPLKFAMLSYKKYGILKY